MTQECKKAGHWKYKVVDFSSITQTKFKLERKSKIKCALTFT